VIDVTGIGSWAQVDLNGEFDLVNSDTIRSVVADLVGQGATDLSIELGHVSFMGAAGLHALLAAHKQVEAAGGRMVIIGDGPFLRRLFVITELDQILPLADLPASTDVPRSGQTTGPVVYQQPDHASPPDRQRLSPERHDVDVSTITENLRQAAHTAVQDIPGCRAASICVVTRGEPRTVAVSDTVAIEVDVAQYTAKEGPCLDAARTSQLVRVDLQGDGARFGRFGPRAQQLGIQAVLSVPVTVAAQLIGTVNLYATSAFAPTTEATATAIATRVTAAVGHQPASPGAEA
jgi:anti-anti-sigma factor